MSKPRHEDGEPKQMNTYVPAKVDKAIAERAKQTGTTKRAVVLAALGAHLGIKAEPDDEADE